MIGTVLRVRYTMVSKIRWNPAIGIEIVAKLTMVRSRAKHFTFILFLHPQPYRIGSTKITVISDEKIVTQQS